MIDRALIRRGAKLELARRDFFSYCNLKAPDFYKPDRKFLTDMCSELQDFYSSDDRVLIINAPPRHGKSRTISCFTEWLLGRDPTVKVMTGSYNENLSTQLSKNVRNSISEKRADKDRIIYNDVFPRTHIKRGDGAMNMWSLEGGYNNYLATSPTGTATGFGATLLIIDDLIKSALEANNADLLEAQWSWFTDTMLSRLEDNGKIIIVMTRWHSQDLAGRAEAHFKSLGLKVTMIKYQAMQESGTMLCPEILSYTDYRIKTASMSPEIAAANYQQEPIDLKGRLYSSFKTYSGELPLFREIRNYTDTADEGSDYLCSIDYGVTFAGDAYILDILYTKAPMEVTEPQTARMLAKDKVNRARIESNNGGKGFARNVQRHLREELKTNITTIKWFHQSHNKRARILTYATWIMQHVYYPEDWHNRWPEYYKSMTTYQREGKNAHDDAQDATTGVAESMTGAGGLSVFK